MFIILLKWKYSNTCRKDPAYPRAKISLNYLLMYYLSSLNLLFLKILYSFIFVPLELKIFPSATSVMKQYTATKNWHMSAS